MVRELSLAGEQVDAAGPLQRVQIGFAGNQPWLGFAGVGGQPLQPPGRVTDRPVAGVADPFRLDRSRVGDPDQRVA